MSFVQNSVVPFQRFRISLACGQVSSIITSFCCPKNLTVVLLRSVRLWQKICSPFMGRIVFVWQYCALSPIFLLCFPSSLVLHHRGYSPVHPFHAGIQCRCSRFQVHDGQMLRRYTNVFCSLRSCHIWPGRLHIRQSLCVTGFQPGFCVPVAQNSLRVKNKCGECLLSTTVRIPNFSKNRCPRARSMWQPRSFKNSSDSRSGAPPGTTYTRNIPLTPAIPTGSITRVQVSRVSSLPKRKVMVLASWIRCVLRSHLLVSICSHLSRVLCPIRKREHPVSITPFANVV